jgi:hypothetical protein
MSAATSSPEERYVTSTQASEILSHYNWKKLEIPLDASHRFNPWVNPSHHSWNNVSYIGRSKRPRPDAFLQPPYTRQTVSIMVSDGAVVFQGSQVPRYIKPDHVYHISQAPDAGKEAPSMLFTVPKSDLCPAGVYVVRYESQPDDSEETEMVTSKANESLGPDACRYQWSLANFEFHEKIKDGVEGSVQMMSALAV